jgi:hypothetical protein
MARFSIGRIGRAVALSALVSLTFAGSAGAQTHSDATLINPFPRTLRVANATPVTEPASGTVLAKFKVTLSGLPLQAGQEVKVSFATQDGTALAGADYTATSGSFSFVSGGTTAKLVQVPVIGDGVLDAAAKETFSLQLRRVIGAQVADAVGIGTINDLHAEPEPDPEPGPGNPCDVDSSAPGPVVDCVPGGVEK